MTTTIVLRSQTGTPLNDVADYIVAEKADLLDNLDKFELTEDAASLFGDGSNSIIKITITYTNPTPECAADIDEILSIAEKRGDIQVDTSEEG